MKKFKLYVNGCSWTDGDVLDYSGLISDLNLTGVGRNYSYPALVAHKLNLGLIDESRYGGSLNRITRMTWEYIIREHNLIKNTIFLFEIPNGFRDEIYSTKYNKYFNITGGLLSNPEDKTEESSEWYDIKSDVINNYYNFHNFEMFDKSESINFMGLLMYIKNMESKFYILQPYEFLHRMGRYEGIFKDVILDENIIKLKSNTFKNDEYQLIQDMCTSEKLSIGDEHSNGKLDSHPGISGHKILSDIIIKYIRTDIKPTIKNII